MGDGPLPIREKKHKASPQHARRLFLQADLSWRDQYGQTKTVKGKFLLDSGCTGPLLNKDFVWNQKVPWIRRDEPISVLSADGQPMTDAGLKYSELLVMRIGYHQEELSWEIGKLEDGIDGYLPIAWLETHNPDIQWDTGKLEWRSEYCHKHCLPVSMQKAVKQFVQLVQEGKPWHVDGAAVWHNEQGENVALQLPECYR